MKYTKTYALALLATVGITFSCQDDRELIPAWESGVHGFAQVTSDIDNFMYNDVPTPLTIDLKWISIDQQLTVTKIDVFVAYNENYIDADENPAIAAHGGDGGLLYKTFEGAAVPANRAPLSISLSQEDLFNLYADATFDYDGEEGPKPEVSVFTNPDNPNRDDLHKFMWNDDISIRWEFTTDDGRKFSQWSPSVCTEFPGANCSYDFTVVCDVEIQKPEGTWTFDLGDDFGDGWQGGYIAVLIDGDEVDQIRIPDGGGASGFDTYVYPGAGQLAFEMMEDDWMVEVQFKITSPSGNVVADVKGATVGIIQLDLCLE
jgi:hypothetical protein